MVQADSAHTTTAAADPPSLWDDAALSSAFRDLEPKLCDLKDIARLASSAIEAAIGSSHKEVTGHDSCYCIPDGQRDALSFAVYHLENMITSIWSEYHAKLDGEAGSGEVQSARASTGASRPPTAIKAGDPISVAIDAHRAAMKAWDDALTVRNALWKDQDSDEYKKAEAQAQALAAVEDRTLRMLATTKPTTLGGATEALRYVTSYYDGTNDAVGVGQVHTLFGDPDLLFGFVSRACDVIKAGLKEVA
jgi:hypothetical protein